MLESHKSLSNKGFLFEQEDQQERGTRDPAMTACDSAGNRTLRAKANLLNGGVKDQEKKGIETGGRDQGSEERGQNLGLRISEYLMV